MTDESGGRGRWASLRGGAHDMLEVTLRCTTTGDVGWTSPLSHASTFKSLQQRLKRSGEAEENEECKLGRCRSSTASHWSSDWFALPNLSSSNCAKDVRRNRWWWWWGWSNSVNDWLGWFDCGEAATISSQLKKNKKKTEKGWREHVMGHVHTWNHQENKGFGRRSLRSPSMLSSCHLSHLKLHLLDSRDLKASLFCSCLKQVSRLRIY